MIKPRVIVLRTAGTNCDEETAFAFRLAEADVEMVHINELARDEKFIKDYQVLAIPGGFTYGDDIASGKILANEIKYKLKDDMKNFINSGKLVIGICNGFQVLVKAGLLPGFSNDMEATLTFNDSGKFEARWVYLRTETRGQKPDNRLRTTDDGRRTTLYHSLRSGTGQANDKCVWTKGLKEMIYLPVAHGEGKFIPKDKKVLDELIKNDQIVFRYVNSEEKKPKYPENPNGSVEDIAGICDTTGRILGLMPHPERHVLGTHHPRWTREGLKQFGDGLEIFRNAVRYVREKL
jgi:phosphoribosylformylglycinamidine (FGAM) synthase-like amidotransferase family enzyme